jgi:dephospho-CoA kinase
VLRVGLTGGLGSGKSTVAGFLRALGAHVIEADEMGRAMMEPGQAVFVSIVDHFGRDILASNGRLNRARLAEIAFKDKRVDELNAIVHPAVIAAQRRWMDELFQSDAMAVAVVESALIFEVERDAQARGEAAEVLAQWRRRFDRIILVTAPTATRLARYVERRSADGVGAAEAEADALRRMAHQIPDSEKVQRADYVLENDGDREALRTKVTALWAKLQDESNKTTCTGSLE